jgi:hypothetical protein
VRAPRVEIRDASELRLNASPHIASRIVALANSIGGGSWSGPIADPRNSYDIILAATGDRYRQQLTKALELIGPEPPTVDAREIGGRFVVGVESSFARGVVSYERHWGRRIIWMVRGGEVCEATDEEQLKRENENLAGSTHREGEKRRGAETTLSLAGFYSADQPEPRPAPARSSLSLATYLSPRSAEPPSRPSRAPDGRRDRVVELLLAGPLSAREIQETVRWPNTTVRAVLRALIRERAVKMTSARSRRSPCQRYRLVPSFSPNRDREA